MRVYSIGSAASLLLSQHRSGCRLSSPRRGEVGECPSAEALAKAETNRVRAEAADRKLLTSKRPMKLRVLTFLLVLLAAGIALAQPQPAPQTPPATQGVLADGDPPLTQQMVTDYSHFIQWALRTPLTQNQGKRIQAFLVDNWKAANTDEISRTLNILALRDRIKNMGLQDSMWAAYQTGTDALYNWKSSPNLEMARWGIAMFDASHKPLVKGNPPLTRQMEDAYEEMGYFMMKVVDGKAPTAIDALERSEFADSIANTYPKLTDEQRANFAQLPKIWVQLRESWPTIDPSVRASLKAAWKEGFYPSPSKPKAGAKKGAKDTTPPPSPTPITALSRLEKMAWVTNSDIFTAMSNAGTPYGLGWGS